MIYLIPVNPVAIKLGEYHIKWLKWPSIMVGKELELRPTVHCE